MDTPTIMPMTIPTTTTTIDADRLLDRLNALLDEMGEIAVAVSGGIDSLTLAQAAHVRLGARAEMVHATSAAVPAEATARVRVLSAREGWNTREIDAGEFDDANYVANPLNRCFYCKGALYQSIGSMSDRQVVSGANADDAHDFRPGMDAAAEKGVRHPFLEAGIDKNGVRAIARKLGLGELAELPASPCLSSRIETGIRVTPEALRFVHAVETLIGERLSAKGLAPRAVRCRVRAEGAAVELDAACIDALDDALRTEIDRRAAECGYPTPLPIEPYRMGSAFLKDTDKAANG